MRLTGAEIVWECLIREDVDLFFGILGGVILPTYDTLTKYPQVHHVHTRHEQGAAHAADGYARATGKVGVVIVTSGPGATNTVTGLATAMMDSSPIVAITGQVPTAVIGTDAFQETDVTGVTLPITKHNYLVMDVDDLAYTIREAFHVARTGRPGPVLIDLPKDVQVASTEFVYPEDEIVLPGYRPVGAAPEEQIQALLEMLEASERPVILAGHGVLMSDATRELVEFAERAQVPVALTLLGKGSMPESHPLCLRMMGMHGEACANNAIQQADLLLAFGMRFDDRVTGNLKTYSPNSRKVHVDIDRSELNKSVPVDLGIFGDLKTVLGQVLTRLAPQPHDEWLAQIREWQADTRCRDIVHQDAEDRLLAAHVIHDIWETTGGDAVVVSDVGQNQMWEAQYYPHERPRTLITSGGLGTMGFGLPAAIGAKLGRPDEEVWAIVGDGGFQMTMTELATARQEGAAVRIAIINNGYLGMVRQWQELFYEKRYTATPLLSPDFVKLAEAFDIPARRVTSREEVIPATEWARQINGPVLLDFWVERHDVVYPMVPAGADLDAMIRRPLPGAE
jgi:acetolactate synthase-1/2/3 large subunit